MNRLYDDALRPSGLATTLSRNLRPLARDGLVCITSGEDRRTRFVVITPHGERALSDARPLWQSAQERVVTELGEARTERFMSELADVLALLRQDGA